MNKTSFSDVLLKVLNFALGLAGLAVVGYGLISHNEFEGLGLVLIMTSALSYVGIRFAIEQQNREEREGESSSRTSGGFKTAS